MNETLRELALAQGSAEWYTPQKYTDLARRVFGGSIELDPASNAAANQYVQAERYYTAEDDGLSRSWVARSVFLNAPGSPKRGVSGQTQWCNYLINQYELGHVDAAIQLIFRVDSSTRWFQSLLGQYPICFVRGRIKFIPPVGLYDNPKNNSPIHASAFLYLGSNNALFRAVFGAIGKVVPAWISAGR